MLKLVAVMIGLALGLWATAAYACNDPAYNTTVPPQPEVQVPPPNSQT